MKKNTLLLFSLLFAVQTLTAQNVETDQISYVSGKDNNILVDVTVTSLDKKSLESGACKAVIEAYLTAGIKGVGGERAIIDETDKSVNSSYFTAINRNRYTVFANSPKKMWGPKKDGNGNFTAQYRVVFRKQSFDKDLCIYGITDCDEKKQTLPTIMVVPMRRADETYQDAIANNVFMRHTIQAVEKELKGKGYTTIDYVTAYENAIKRGEITSDNEDSFINQLVNSTGADIKVEVWCNVVKKDYRTISATVSAKSIYCSDGSIGATNSKTFEGEIAAHRCCTGAVHQLMDEFVPYIIWPRTNTKAALLIGIKHGSMFNMDSDVDNVKPASTLSELLYRWVYRNTLDLHQKSKSDVQLTYDNITINKKTSPIDFAMNLRRYISTLSIDGVKLKATYNIEGMSIYIQISEIEDD